MRIFVLCCAVVLAAVPGPAQSIVMTTASAVLDQATIADVDFVRSTTPKWLFTVDLRVASPGNPVEDLVMEITGDLALANGRSATEVTVLKTLPFTVRESLTLTNLDLARAGIKGEYTFNTSKISELGVKDIALSGTRLPSGTYTLNIVVYKYQNGVPTAEKARGKIVFVLGNPSSVELLFPLDGDNSVGQFPLFQWLYDGQISRISVYERLAGQTSMEEAAGGVPHLVREVSGYSFQYPTAGVRTLQPGRSYVWFVDGLLRSAGGTIQMVRSPLRSFTVSASGGLALEESLLDRLERALGPTYRALFDQIRANEYTASGALTLNNSPITPAQLERLITLIRQNPDLVKGVRVE
jgi:hypothetical protein